MDVITASTRIAWKKDTLDYWHAQAESHGRALWATEMQATPWIGTTGFTTDDLIASALAYRGGSNQSGCSVADRANNS